MDLCSKWSSNKCTWRTLEMPNLLHPTHGQWFISCVEVWLKCSSWIQHWLISMPSYTLGNLRFIWEMQWSTLLGHRRLEVETRTKRKKKTLYKRLVLLNRSLMCPVFIKNEKQEGPTSTHLSGCCKNACLFKMIIAFD